MCWGNIFYDNDLFLTQEIISARATQSTANANWYRVAVVFHVIIVRKLISKLINTSYRQIYVGSLKFIVTGKDGKHINPASKLSRIIVEGEKIVQKAYTFLSS